MNIKRCLYCYQKIEDGASGFHRRCSIKMFGKPEPPLLEYDSHRMEELAREIVIRSITMTGVQSKLSLAIEPIPGDPKRSRFTIVGLWGGYILKPPSPEFSHLPENEDLTMHLSSMFGIPTAEHSLIRLASGELAYITKRFDRSGVGKIAMEDMCQLTETLTSDKYRGSMEKIARHIAKYSSQPGLDKITFFEMVLFSFLTGNADMHLKNFSLITSAENIVQLSPAYHMLSSKLVIPDDKEELALTLNGKKNKIERADFDQFAAGIGIPEKVLQQTYHKFSQQLPSAEAFIRNSFLTSEDQDAYIQLMRQRAAKIDLV